MPSIYLINPRAFPSFFGSEVTTGSKRGRLTSVADLAIATVAAMVPDDFGLRICDELLEPVDLEDESEFVGLTGKVTQFPRMAELARHFRERGQTVIIGGPYASLAPGTVREHCDILVQGEMESIGEQFFSDLRSGEWKNLYLGGRPSLDQSPLPRWDLYPNEYALWGSVQTSRGCPFECEFCDVIQYLGRNQRHKPVGLILEELEQLYRLGYRHVFLCDDNLTVYRKRAKELLAALRDWNHARDDGPIEFATQVSIDSARDPELLDLIQASGLTTCFIGIETPNELSLKETGKKQNLGVDLVSQIDEFLRRGVGVIAGMVVGFDSDGPDIFQRQFDFAMRSGVPVFLVSTLVAPDATPLRARMKKEGRLLNEIGDATAQGHPWDTNISPAQMTSEELKAGMQWLAGKIYGAENFHQRLVSWLDKMIASGAAEVPRRHSPSYLARPASRIAWETASRIRLLGEKERQIWRWLLQKMKKYPGLSHRLLELAYVYAQVRFVYQHGGFWRPTEELSLSRT